MDSEVYDILRSHTDKFPVTLSESRIVLHF